MGQKYQKIIGLDPGLRCTGWGIIETDGFHLRHIANGFVKTKSDYALSDRLLQLFEGLQEAYFLHKPDEAAVEETFVNMNPQSTLKLGLARGAVVLSAAKYGMSVAEYKPNKVKKAVTGVGHAQKEQVQMMLKVLLPQAKVTNPDAADALAVAICHSRYRETIMMRAET